ncbi:Fc.00g073290.m01.CDS01 [Cosmosporella sp. VM-42]
MPIHALTPKWSIGENRQVDLKHVQKLYSIFKKGELKRKAKNNYFLLLCSREDVSMMRKHLEVDETATATATGETLCFDDWLSVHEGKRAEIMAGQHWVKALEAYVQWDTLKTEITNALQLGSDIHFPITRLVTIWRNERWRDMATCWCETSVGRDTFKISTWNWMISNRIDDYWFSAFRSVLETLSQLPGNATKHLTGADWEEMSKSLPAGRTDTDVQELFYLGNASQNIGRLAKRRPNLLAALGGQSYWEVYIRILKTPRLRFPDIHRLLDLSQDDGRVLSQVMSYVVAWLNPNPTVVVDQWNKKPPLRNDLMPELQHCSAQFVRSIEKKLDTFLWYMTLRSPPENASVLLQQEVLDFT